MREQADVVIIGGGLAGWIAALECAKFDLDVRIFVDPEAQTAVHTGELDGVTGIDFGFESFTPGDAVAELATEFGLQTETLLPRHTLLDTGERRASMPDGVVAGMPANPLSAEVRAFTNRSNIRVYADRVMPVLKLGAFDSVGELATRRFGRQFVQHFTTPWCQAVFGVSPDELSLARVAPLLNARVTAFGSLSGAVLSLTGRSDAQLRLVGGGQSLMDALRKRASEYLVHEVAERVTAVRRSGEHWEVAGSGTTVQALHVIAAVDPEAIGFDRAPGVSATARPMHIITAAVDCAAPLGPTGVLRSTAQPYLSAARPAARSAALGGQLGEGVEIIRVVASADDTAELLSDGEAVLRRVVSDLGGELTRVRDIHHEDWTILRPWAGLNDPEPGAARSDESGTLEWVGQWTAGPGAARVISHARGAATRIRRKAIEARQRPTA